ncbi:DUF2637 domain-containing protein [Streptomyces sp. BI20]|uniref:DUF2637 domain-containing protein n=1 Tax=Streptomyces sp. BI20 TaxID=3403460 RepID=UPI003C78D373
MSTLTKDVAPCPHHDGPRRMTAWDRAAIAALGLAGFVFSFDALRQIALAMHAAPLLSWLFPVFLDGFIAYSTRALVLMRSAPFRARLYVWALFAISTGTSIWANCLHSVTMNGVVANGVVHLSDKVVAVLAAVAPLALAGAVHLYIHMARTVEVCVCDGPGNSPPAPTARTEIVRTPASAAPLGPAGQPRAVPPTPAPAVRERPAPPPREDGPVEGDLLPPAEVSPATPDPAPLPRPVPDGTELPGDGAEAPGTADGRHDDGQDDAPMTPPRPTDLAPSTDGTEEAAPAPHPPVPDGTATARGDEGRSEEDQALRLALPLAVEAARAAGRVTRDVVGDAVRVRHPISNARLTVLVDLTRKHLAQEDEERSEHEHAADTRLW